MSKRGRKKRFEFIAQVDPEPMSEADFEEYKRLLCRLVFDAFVAEDATESRQNGQDVRQRERAAE